VGPTTLPGGGRGGVRRASRSSVTLYIPATDHTFSVTPEADSFVYIGGRKYRPRDLERGQELNIYVSIDRFTQPIPVNEEIIEIAFVDAEHRAIAQPIETVAALPTTASLWPAVGSLGVLFVIGGMLLRRSRTA